MKLVWTLPTLAKSRTKAVLLALACVCGTGSVASAALVLTPGEVTLSVDTLTGSVRLYGYESANPAETPKMNLYQISSDSGAMNFSKWVSLQDQSISTTPAGGWGELPFGLNDTLIAEQTNNFVAYTSVGTGASLPYFDLGLLYRPGATQDLSFKWFDTSFNEHADASVQYVSVPEPTAIAAAVVGAVAFGLRRRQR